LCAAPRACRSENACCSAIPPARSPSHILIGSSGILFNTYRRRSKLDRPGLAAAGVELIKFQVHRQNHIHPRRARLSHNHGRISEFGFISLDALRECRNGGGVKTNKIAAERAIDCLFECKSHPPKLAKAQF
jgi:hypothetical protein